MDWAQVECWRKAERRALIAAREAIDPEVSVDLRERVTAHLAAMLQLPAACTVAFCWPYRNEIDTRHAVRAVRERGAGAAMPVVAGKAMPLQFRRWWPGAPMKKGVLGIPYPDGTPLVHPDLALVPMVAYDDGGFRLGYGGGYFDRTLAAAAPRPIAIGIVASRFHVPSIHPQPHDIPMDFVVTELGVQESAPGGLVPVDAAAAAARLATLLATRGLPPPAGADAGTSLASPVCYAAQFPGYFGESPEGSEGHR